MGTSREKDKTSQTQAPDKYITRLLLGRVFLAFTLILLIGALTQFIQQAIEEEVLFVTRSRTAFIIAGGISGLGLVVALVASWTPLAGRVFDWLDAFQSQLKRWRLVGWVVFVALIGVFPYLARSYYGRYLINIFPRFFAFWIVVVVGALLLDALLDWKHWTYPLVTSLLVFGLGYHLSGFIADISAYPLSLGWSETSRYYYASTFFAERIYGFKFELPHNNPTRYLLQAVPFLFGNPPLWVHRLWQALLSIGFTLLAAYLVMRRLPFPGKPLKWMFVFWAALFMFQAPIFNQMLSVAVIVLWAFDSKKFWRSLVVVLVASAWAGLTRINWIPMPALIAITFYLMKRPIKGQRFMDWVNYFWQPAVYAIAGSLAGLATQEWYTTISGHDPEVLGAFFDSDLLWYRLLPNTSYPLGILTGTLLVSAPLLIYLLSMLRPVRAWHWLRLLGLAAIMAVLCAGGLVISAKIGGGTNLHNLDGYMLILLLIAAALFTRTFMRQDGTPSEHKPHWSLMGLIVLVPVVFAISSGGPFESHDFDEAERALTEINHYIRENVPDDAEVLFISQRHLLTFYMVENVKLVTDYEKLFLMEMVMAYNDPYMVKLENDLNSQRFALIVTDPLFLRTKEPVVDALAEENNLYVTQVTRPMLCNYEVEEYYPELQVQLLVPLAEPKCE